MSKTCVNHRETPAATMCHQCHVPICRACSIVAPQGTFCSPECSVLHREVKARIAEPAPRGMPRLELLLKLVAAFALSWVGFYGIHVAAARVPKLRRVDVIGRLLQVFEPREKGNSE
jgi:hypothetical protein